MELVLITLAADHKLCARSTEPQGEVNHDGLSMAPLLQLLVLPEDTELLNPWLI